MFTTDPFCDNFCKFLNSNPGSESRSVGRTRNIDGCLYHWVAIEGFHCGRGVVDRIPWRPLRFGRRVL